VQKKSSRPPRPNRKLQSIQFAAHRRDQTQVIVHLLNGVRLQGVVLRADNYALLLGKSPEDEQPQLVYKRAIACVVPAGEPTASTHATPDSPEFVDLFVPRGRRRG